MVTLRRYNAKHTDWGFVPVQVEIVDEVMDCSSTAVPRKQYTVLLRGIHCITNNESAVHKDKVRSDHSM